MTLADIINKFYKGTAIEILETVEDKTTQTAETNDIKTTRDTAFDVLTYKQLYEADVVMFECVKKNTLKVWTHREN